MNLRANDEMWDGYYAQIKALGGGNPALYWRWQKAIQLLQIAPGRSRFCDIGCGDGQFSLLVRTRYPDVPIVGFDGSAVGIQKASARIPDGKFRVAELEGSFAAIEDLQQFATHAICTEVLEHLDHPVQALRLIRHVLAPEGRLVVTVPSGPMSASDRHFGHRKHYTKALLRSELEEAGFRIENILAAGFPFLTIYRWMVVAHGRRAVEAQLGDTSQSRLIGFLFSIFRFLFRFNMIDAPLGGWQLFAVAYKK